MILFQLVKQDRVVFFWGIYLPSMNTPLSYPPPMRFGGSRINKLGPILLLPSLQIGYRASIQQPLSKISLFDCLILLLRLQYEGQTGRG